MPTLNPPPPKAVTCIFICKTVHSPKPHSHQCGDTNQRPFSGMSLLATSAGFKFIAITLFSAF